MNRFLKYIYVVVGLAVVTVFGCPIYKIFNIKCVTCGVTRAWLNFLYGNYIASFSRNWFFLPLTFIFLRIIYCDFTEKKMTAFEKHLYILIVGIAFIYNLFRNFCGL